MKFAETRGKRLRESMDAMDGNGCLEFPFGAANGKER